MALLKNRGLWAALLGVVLSGGLLLLVVGYLGLVVYSGVVSGTSIVQVLLDIAVPALLGIALLLVILAVSGISLIWVLVQNASLPQSGRVAAVADRLEREYPPLRMIGLSELLTPPEPSAEEQAERALADLKQQYIDGEITEAEFERKVDRLITHESIDEARAIQERREVVDDEENG